MTIDLGNTHPGLQATAAARRMSRDLFEGAEAVKLRRDAYLYRERNESDEDFELRLKRAVLDPWVEKIVAARQAMLFAKPHARALPAALGEWADDVDLRGTTAAIFFADVAREAQVDGIHWVLADKPRMPLDAEGQPLVRTARDERAANMRPFFEHVPADAVLDWEVGEDRKLLWAVVAQEAFEPRGPEGWGQAPETKSQWKIWTRTAWRLYQERAAEPESAPATPTESYELVDQGVNPTGVVPLVPFFGVRRTDWSGWPVCRSVLAHVLQIYNKDSDLDWFERLAAHPIPYAVSPEKPERLDAGKGLWLKSQAGGGATAVGYLETTGQGFASIRESIRDLRYRILAIALAQAQKDSAQVQSADSQREDRRIFTAGLKTASLWLESSETMCWELMAKWAEASTEGIAIEYSRDFDDRTVEAAMIATLKDLVAGEMLPLDDLLQTLVEGEILPTGYDIEEAKRKIEEDAARRALPGAGGHEEEEI